MRIAQRRCLLIAILPWTLMFPLAAYAQNVPSELWDRVPADILRMIPDELKPKPTEDLGSDAARQAVLAMLVRVQKCSPDMTEALIVWEDGATLTGKNREILGRYVEENRTALQTLKAIPTDAIRIRKQQDASGISTSLSPFMYLGLLDATFLAEEREYEEAAQRLIQLMRFAAFLYHSEAESGFYAGTGVWHARTLRIARYIAQHEDIPKEVLLSLVSAAEATLSDETRMPSLRRNFEMGALPILAGLPVEDSVSDLIERQVRIWGPKSLKIPRFDLNRDLGKRTGQIQTLLKGHPNPLDREETISLIMSRYRQAIDVAQGRLSIYGQSPPAFVEEVACWPDELSLHPLGVLRLALGSKQEVPSREDLEGAQAELVSVDNPLGKHLASFQDPMETLDLFSMYSANSRCGIVALAARAYHQRFHRLPDSLAMLVDAGLLSKIPQDPFGSELRYLREQRKVWSVGRNGHDDNGLFDSSSASLNVLRIMAPPGVEVPEIEDSESPEADDRAVEILLPRAKKRTSQKER